MQPEGLPEGFASSNGRIEATEIDIATKTAGRVVDVRADEGDFVTAGQVLAQMDTDVLNAQAERKHKQKRGELHTAIATAKSLVAQGESEKTAAQSTVAQGQAELDLAIKNYNRNKALVATRVITAEEFDSIRVVCFIVRRQPSAGRRPTWQRRTLPSLLPSPRSSSRKRGRRRPGGNPTNSGGYRRQHLAGPRATAGCNSRVAQAGEVLPMRAVRCLIWSISPSLMTTFFLHRSPGGPGPTRGPRPRLVLDAAPQFVIPAKVTFVADVAPVHPQDGGDSRGAAEADVPDQGPHSPGPVEEARPQGENRAARHGLRAARPPSGVAGYILQVKLPERGT